jgi:hypothetical protein
VPSGGIDEWARRLARRGIGRSKSRASRLRDSSPRPPSAPGLESSSTPAVDLPLVHGQRFDRITRAIGTVLPPLGKPASRGEVLQVLLRALVATAASRRFLPEVRFVSQANKSSEQISLERMQYVRTRQARDIQNVDIDPADFLARLEPASRAEFLGVMTPPQQRQFMDVKTSREFFRLLTPDQRAVLAVTYQPRYSSAVASPGYYLRSPRYDPVPSAVAYTAAASPTRRFTSIGAPVWSPVVSIIAGDLHLRRNCRLEWRSCYYTYKATPATDRDGAPCTYGPYPCGSGIPPNPPGKTFETPFCPGADADNYGCGELANQVLNVTACPRPKDSTQPPRKGVPLEHICNATDNFNCTYADVSPATFKSVVTDCSYRNAADQPSRCITDSYKDPQTGDVIQVPVKTDAHGCSPCIQQSDPGACGGIDCPCPGLYIAQSAFRSPNSGSALMNPDNYLNGVLIPYISVTGTVFKTCGLSTGMFVTASTTYDEQGNPTENPADWVAGVLGDTGGRALGEMSYAMRYRLGMPGDNVPVTFRIYPQVKVGWPVDVTALDALKNKYVGVCCPGNIDDQCHAAEQRGTCITDSENPNARYCQCSDGWLPDTNGDCTWFCPDSDANRWIGTTDSGYQECSGNGRCVYQPTNQNGDTIGECICNDGWWAGLSGKACISRDCVKPQDTDDAGILPCYGHGECHHNANAHELGTCTCDDGWTNGSDGDQYCSEQLCAKDCSGHGICMHDETGRAFCACDVEHGWFGSDCSKLGCFAQHGRICSGNGTCHLDAHGIPFCACPDEWGGPDCRTRQCPGCPAGAASCTDDRDWEEILCLCLCGNNCERKWTCHCHDGKLKPPGCTSRKCCSGFWGECNVGIHDKGYAGGGVCQENGVCACYDNFDPDPEQCCGNPLPGDPVPPPGFGQACAGTSSRTIEINCPASATGSCSFCQGFEGGSFTLRPGGGGIFHDQFGNAYALNEGTCALTLTAFGPNTNAMQCGKSIGQVSFWLKIDGGAGSGVTPELCKVDCSDCHLGRPCTVAIH